MEKNLFPLILIVSQYLYFQFPLTIHVQNTCLINAMYENIGFCITMLNYLLTILYLLSQHFKLFGGKNVKSALILTPHTKQLPNTCIRVSINKNVTLTYSRPPISLLT